MGPAALLRALERIHFLMAQETAPLWGIFLLPFHGEHAILEERKISAAAVQ